MKKNSTFMKIIISFMLILWTFTCHSQNNSLFNKASENYQKKEYHIAIKLYTEFLSDSIHSSALNNRALCYTATGELKKAEKDLVLALQINPHSSLYHYSIAVVYDRMNDYVNSIIHYHMTIKYEKEPQYKSFFGLGSAYYFSNKLDNARKYLTKANEINPLKKDALNNLAWSYLDESPQKSCELFLEAYNLDPSDNVTINNLGYSHLLCGDLDKAYQLFQKALKLAPNNSFIHRNIGLYYMHKDERNKACENLNQALNLKIVEKWGESYITELLNYCTQK